MREYVNDANGVVCTVDYDYRGWGGYELGWHLKDHLGSTVAVVADPVLTVPPENPQRVGQRILWTGNYESFGRPDSNVPVCPGAFDNPIQFTGYYSDGDVFEHYYAHARYYDPYTGRFLSRDPADFEYDKSPIAINRYPYAGNNPIRFVDPNGEFIFAAIFGLVFEAIFTDVLAFAALGGVYELAQGGDFADFMGGFIRGAFVGAVSSITAGLLTESSLAGAVVRSSASASLAGELPVYALTGYQSYAISAGVMTGMNQMAMMARYGANIGGADAPFPLTGHHGFWGLGAMGASVLFGGAGTILGEFAFGLGSLLSFDDFVQHTVLQNINPTWFSPLHWFYRWARGGE